MKLFKLLKSEFLKLRRNYFIFALFVLVALFPLVYRFFLSDDFFSTEYARWSESRNLTSIRLFFLSKILSASRYLFSFFCLGIVVQAFSIDKPKRGINIIAFLPIAKSQFLLVKLSCVVLMLLGVILVYALLFFVVSRQLQEVVISFDIPISFADSLSIGLHLLLTSLFYVFFLSAAFFIFPKLVYGAYAISVLVATKWLPGGLFIFTDFLKSSSYFVFPIDYWFFAIASIFFLFFSFKSNYAHFIAQK